MELKRSEILGKGSSESSRLVSTIFLLSVTHRKIIELL